MKQFYIKFDINDSTIEVSTFNEMDLCAFLDLETRIKINRASIQLFGIDSSSDFDINVNQEILNNFDRIEYLFNFFKLPLDYSIFELDLDVFSDDFFNVSILDGYEATFRIEKGNTKLLKKICNYLAKNNSDIIYSLVNSNFNKYVCVRPLKDHNFEYKIIDSEIDVKLFFK